MLKKFSEGLMFGAGFTISFVIVWFLAAFFISPIFLSSKIEQFADGHMSGHEINKLPDAEAKQEPAVDFHNMSLEDQIKHSSVIAIAKYEPGADGKVKAMITEFLKKDPGVQFHYKLGDEYQRASYLPKENTIYGDGVVIFFTGSPASMKRSMTIEADRITALGDLPVELLRKKCSDPNA